MAMTCPDEIADPLLAWVDRVVSILEAAMTSPVRYARSGDVHIAYRTFGDGPRDIVLIPGTISHVELLWELPSNQHLLKRLTAFARVIVFDKRGQGLSDRVGRADARGAGRRRAGGDGRGRLADGDDLRLVGGRLDVADVRRDLPRANFGPRAVRQLRLHEEPTSGRSTGAVPGLPRRGAGALGRGRAGGDQRAEPPRRQGGRPVVRRDRAGGASPGSILTLLRANYEIDVRHLLSSIRVPTLVLHRLGDALVPVAAGRYVAEHIPGARYAEIAGTDHLVLDQETQDIIADEIEEFITGAHQRLQPDRVLATVMFVDIVGSTERAAALGDARWRDLLDRYYAAIRKELSAFRGNEMDRAGDGLLATFDGPARAIRCACSVRERVRQLGLQVRIGLHTGECELVGEGVGGIAVHIGARVAATAAADEVLVSSTVRDLVAGSGLKFADRGVHALKGLPEQWRLYCVE